MWFDAHMVDKSECSHSLELLSGECFNTELFKAEDLRMAYNRKNCVVFTNDKAVVAQDCIKAHRFVCEGNCTTGNRLRLMGFNLKKFYERVFHCCCCCCCFISALLFLSPANR